MKKIFKALGAIVLVAALGIGVWFAIPYLPIVKSETTTTVVNAEEKEVHNLTNYDVVTSFEDVSYITTQRSDYSVTIGFENSKTIGDSDLKIPFSTAGGKLECHGSVQASYDLNEIFEGMEIDNENLTFRIELPEPEITSNALNDVVCIEENNSIFNKNKSDDYLIALDSAKEAGLQQAIDNGLYKLAEENAMRQIRELLSKFSDYEVEFV